MKNNRRKFLTDLGKLSGVLMVSGEILEKFPLMAQEKIFGQHFKPKPLREPLEYRFAPPSWQTTYSLADDSQISLISKTGELLLGNSGTGNDFNAFPLRVTFGMTGETGGEYVEQRLESPEIPIITTRMKYGKIEIKITSFASKWNDEGRVDNHFYEISSTESASPERKPALVITSSTKFKHLLVDDNDLTRKQASVISSDPEERAILCMIDGPVSTIAKGNVFVLTPENIADPTVLKFFIRFPRESQTFETLKAGLNKGDEILSSSRAFWQSRMAVEHKTKMTVHPDYHGFLSASVRNIVQTTEVGPKKRIFHSGPTFFKNFYPAEAIFIIEALRFMGYDTEAQEGLETIWNMQDQNGAFFGSAGEHSFKDTAAAVYALARNADLTQDFDFFNEMFPDSLKGMLYLQQLRLDEYNKGKSLNGKNQFLPPGTITTGADGVRADMVNTLWTMMGLQAAIAVANKFLIPYRDQMRDFNKELVQSVLDFSKREMKTDPKGFKYLPMLLADDPYIRSKDKSKHPAAQFAQVGLTQAIFPGLLYPKEHVIVQGHIALMNAILQEDIPAGTGFLGANAVQTYHAPAYAQLLVWAGFPDAAVNIFRGFLNHASPLLSWRDEQTLLNVKKNELFGDMPHSLAAAQCILFLRNSLILEDRETLRLLDGLVYHDINANKPISMEYSPTKWGRVSISLEPVDVKTWTFSFKREGFKVELNPKFTRIEFPRRITQDLQLDKIVGCKYLLQGNRVIVEPTETSWVATFRNFRL
ncbi:MAG: hypothetical protein ACHQQQ_13095 [Bacteroidota bacterium]